ncbi:MAG: ABC transporter ATP-binding protein, partial [Oscillospiraceae bacterium]|nr:ABC transporter ATP-binding protein [Oscillospiraceae bacterium]
RLCMLMDEKINLLILDEPTNHLDIASREWVECAIEEYEGTLIFVSHDRYFVDKFATRIWELEDGTIKDYLCGYAKYRSLKENAAIRPIPQTEKPAKKEKPVQKTDSKALEKEVRRLEREIDKQEQSLAALDEQLLAAASDYKELLRLTAEKEAAETALADLMAQWEAAAAQLEL